MWTYNNQCYEYSIEENFNIFLKEELDFYVFSLRFNNEIELAKWKIKDNIYVVKNTALRTVKEFLINLSIKLTEDKSEICIPPKPTKKIIGQSKNCCQPVIEKCSCRRVR